MDSINVFSKGLILIVMKYLTNNDLINFIFRDTLLYNMRNDIRLKYFHIINY